MTKKWIPCHHCNHAQMCRLRLAYNPNLEIPYMLPVNEGVIHDCLNLKTSLKNISQGLKGVIS